MVMRDFSLDGHWQRAWISMASHNRRRSVFRWFAGCLVICAIGCGGVKPDVSTKPDFSTGNPDVPQSDEIGSSGETTQDAETPGKMKPTIEELVAQLASRNTAPVIGDERRPQFPEDFDWTDQDRVRGVWNELFRRADENLSVILDHCDDQRYCITYVAHKARRNLTVGEICWDIVTKRVDRVVLNGDPPVHMTTKPPHELFSMSIPIAEIPQWCKDRKTATLADLQLEAFDIVERQITASETFREKEWYIRRLNGFRDAIKATGKAISTGNEAWDREVVEFYGPEKPHRKRD
jgi:hypothetical protein